MGLRDRLGDARRSAEGVLDTDVVRATGRNVAGAGKRAVSVTQDADDWIGAQLQAVPPPALPLTDPWKLSIGAIIARHPKAPRLTGKLLSPLDRFGAITIGPDEVGFDGDEVEWERVTEIRTSPVAEIACGAIWDFAIDDLRKRLPPVPGRKWAVTKVLQILMALAIDVEDQIERTEGEDELTRVACEIGYRGRLRTEKKAAVGLFSGLALCSMPQVSQALVRSAFERGVPVVDAAPHKTLSVNERVARMRTRRAALAAQADELETIAGQDASPVSAETGPSDVAL